MHLFRQFVLKVHSRCNLACDHCYVYESVDQSWRSQPMSMSRRTLKATAEAVAAYAEHHQLAAVQIVLHGGEPLLVGPERLAEMITGLRSAIEPVTRLELSVQTNGVLLDERFADIFLAERVRVGVSLDGGRVANDRHRLFAHGGSSYDPVVEAVRLMTGPKYSPVFAGLLCTVDVHNDPIAVFDDLASLDPPTIDLLLPHATWEHPPDRADQGPVSHGRWLASMFDHWYDAPPRVGIRLFEELVNALLGGASLSEAVGMAAPESLVVETDGSLQETDALKVAYAGAPATGYDVHRHSLDDVHQDPAVLAVSSVFEQLSDICQSCPVVSACGGGLYPHRYRPGAGFANPSVYCHDLRHLIDHVSARLSAVPELVHLIPSPVPTPAV